MVVIFMCVTVLTSVAVRQVNHADQHSPVCLFFLSIFVAQELTPLFYPQPFFVESPLLPLFPSDDSRLKAENWQMLLANVTTMPILQDSFWEDAWDRFGGSKGDLFVYDREGRLFKFFCNEASSQYILGSCDNRLLDGGLTNATSYEDVKSAVIDAALSNTTERCSDYDDDFYYYYYYYDDWSPPGPPNSSYTWADDDDDDDDRIDINNNIVGGMRDDDIGDHEMPFPKRDDIIVADGPLVPPRFDDDDDDDDDHFTVDDDYDDDRIKKIMERHRHGHNSSGRPAWVYVAAVAVGLSIITSTIVFMNWRKNRLNSSTVMKSSLHGGSTRFTRIPTSEDYQDRGIDMKVTGSQGESWLRDDGYGSL